MADTKEITSRDFKLTDQHSIRIEGARANNLKNISLTIPKDELVVVTGLSGSGKSSLIMDTLYAEGQRRYVESLSSYARQFLNRMKKPDVDFIRGLCPAIAIEQRTSGSNARSTVGSLTEINDYLRLLYARVGKMYSPVSGKVVKKHSVSDVVDWIIQQEESAKIQLWIYLPVGSEERTVGQEFDLLLQKGYTRYKKTGDNSFSYIQDLLDDESNFLKKKVKDIDRKDFLILIDRFVVKQEDKENIKRIADSVHTAFMEGEGDCIVEVMDVETKSFNNRFELDGIEFPELTPQLFNYNNPYGACKRCEGYGRILGIDEDKVIPNKELSVYDGAIACWKGKRGGKYLDKLLSTADEFDFPLHTPYEDLSEEQKDILWEGNKYINGIYHFFNQIEQKSYKIQNRVLLARYRGRTRCPECKGSRLRKEALYVKVADTPINKLVFLPINELHAYFENIELNEHEAAIAKRLLVELNTRLSTMVKIGLGYLTIERLSSTLSGGEIQRIHLTRTLSSNLTHSMYILDEPSIGLHPKDSDQLVNVLYELRDLGNTVIVVEHEEEIIRKADSIVELGPDAGIHGGEVIYAGAYKDFLANAENSYTSDYLTGKREIPLPDVRREPKRFINILGAKEHNLQRIDVDIPLQALTVITGVSGSGKSTLVQDILYPALLQKINDDYGKKPGSHKGLEGALDGIDKIEMIDQNPIGRSSRSNPVTYIKAYDGIRNLMANQQLSKIRGYKPKHFSFNVEGGRCENCQGEGSTTVEMQFLADVKLECEECRGRRFKDEVLEVEYYGKNIFDILEMSVEEAIDFFENEKSIQGKLQPLQDVGLGYIKLGQASSTLSGGEAQRVKLAFYLSKEGSTDRMLFIFDEPTTGLHFHDIHKLLSAVNALIERGHTVIIVEHNMDVIKCGDWIVDLGPEGGKDGGRLLFQGPLEGILDIEESHTAQYLKEKI